jgi:uncharacterized protein (TIGR02444 family)
MAAPAPAGALWRFSLAVYGAPGVAAACLELQDRWGADVNLALAVCWAGASGRGRLGIADIARLDRLAAPLRADVVEPLRKARRALKRHVAHGALRARIQELELEAEGCVQRILEAEIAPREMCEPPTLRPAAARTNLEVYLRYLGAPAPGTALAAAVDEWIRSQ